MVMQMEEKIGKSLSYLRTFSEAISDLHLVLVIQPQVLL
jgi:hypothetical protein